MTSQSQVKVARCCYRDENIVVAFTSESLFIDIMNELQSRFKFPSNDSMDIFYTFSSHPMYKLMSDKDVEMMFVYQSLLNASVVDIVVRDSDPIIKDSNLSVKGDQSSNLLDVPYYPSDLNSDEDAFNGLNEPAMSYLSESWRTYITHVNQRFDSVTEFREKLVKYAVESGFSFVYEKNDKVRVTAYCIKRYSDGCSWHVHARVYGPNGVFTIRKLNNVHTCTGNIREHKHSMVNSKLVASVMSEKVRDKPSITSKEIVNDLKKSYGLDISYWNAWYGKELAKKDLHGDDAMSYKQLEVYIDNLKQSNPGSYCYLECDPNTRRFKRIFVSYAACINGFKYCRPVLCLDGTFLKNKYRGVLLATTAMNGNRGIFPFAFAVVDSENEENWHWFLDILGDILCQDSRDITFISDRHQGNLDGVSNLFPSSPHGYCLQHLGKNLMLKFQGGYDNHFREGIALLFKKYAYAPTKNLFAKHMEELKKVRGAPVEQFLKGIDVKHWANAYFKGVRYGEMCSNIAESFNSWISKERYLPITQLLDGIRAKVMTMMGNWRSEADTWTSMLCPVMEDELSKNVEIDRHWNVSRASDSIFEVQSQFIYVVNLEKRSYSCGWWGIKGFSCAHAIVAIRQCSHDVYDYVECYFTTAFYKKSYAMTIYPVPNILLEHDLYTSQDDVGILPPKTKKLPGRPKNKRIKSAGEVQSKIRCGRYGSYERHNKRTCSRTI